MSYSQQHIVAVYPGSFDPVTHGHLDVIRRASRLFNELVIGVGRNPDKDEVFTPVERVELLTPHIEEFANVRVEAYEGLTIDFVRACRGSVLVRGIRDVSDLSTELVQANLNLAIGQIETIFLVTRDQHVLTSSTYVKQIYEMSQGEPERVERLVPRNVALALADKLQQRRQNGC